MKLFLTGASGLVGAAVATAAARRGHEVIGVSGRFTGPLEGLARRLTLDLADEAALTAAVLESFPDAIINCAAMSEPAQCDAQPALSEKLNIALPATLARLAHHLSARFIHISSEQVFDGAQTAPYRVDSPTNPITRYGRQKLASEHAVLAAAPEFSAIVRAPLLMGDSPGAQRSLHERLLADWAAGRTVRLYADESRQPCTGENLADALVELAERPALRGVFHWAGRELFSRVQLGEAIRAHFKLTDAQAPIVVTHRTDNPAIAASRQACLALDLAPLLGTLKTQPQTLSQQLASLKVPPLVRAWYHSL